MWIVDTFLWQWVHVQSCLCSPYPPTATVLQCLSDGNEGTWGIPHIPLSTLQKALLPGGDEREVAHFF